MCVLDRLGVRENSLQLALSAAVIAALFSLAPLSVARAELPNIRLDIIKPLGAAAGSTVELEVSAADAEDAQQLLFDHPGLKAEFVSPGKFKVTVAGDVPDGTYDVRLRGRFGVSNPRLFAVSRGLTDVLEKEPNNRPAEAQPVTVNSAIAGTIDGNGQDLFRVTLKQGQRLTLDCQAGKLDSELDASLAVFGPNGAVLASNSDYRGRDPKVDFLCPADGDYLIEAHDLSYRGGYPYRLLISDRPYIENVFPRAAEPGKPVELVALGYNFGTAGQPSPWKIDDRPLEEFRFTVNAPAADPLGYRFIDHPTDHTVLPTAATCTLRGWQERVPLDGAWPPVTLLAADGPVTIEQEPNDAADQARPISLPLTLSGRFDKPRDADWFEFTVAEAGRHEIQVYSERIAGQADPYVTVIDDQNNRIGEIDDFGHRINAFDGHLRDPVGAVELAAGRKYRLMVQDRYGRGGARYQYVLTVRRPKPDFFVAAIHGANPGPAGLNLWQGGAAWLDLVVHREDGYDGPVTIKAEGLPPGMHAADIIIPSDTRAPLVLWTDADCPACTGPIRLLASGTRAGASIAHEVRPYTRVWSNPSLGSSRPTRDLVAAVLDKAPYALQAMPDRATVPVGGKLDLKLSVVRHWPECQAAVRVIGLSLPGGFQFAESEIPAGANEKTCVLEVGNMRPGDYTLVFLGQAQTPFKKDAAAKEAPNTLVSMPSRPITITVTGK